MTAPTATAVVFRTKAQARKQTHTDDDRCQCQHDLSTAGCVVIAHGVLRIDGTGHGRESVGKRQAEYLVVPGVPPQRDHNPAVTRRHGAYTPYGFQKQVDQQLEKQHHAEQNADCRPLLCHAGQTEIKQTAHTVPTVEKIVVV